MKHYIIELDSLPRDRGAFQALLNEARYQQRRRRRQQLLVVAMVIVVVLLLVLPVPITGYQLVAAGAAIVFVASSARLMRRQSSVKCDAAATDRPG
jgi:heme O synthase-like polyprenyltransferase